jgi:hypothetical protein
MYTLEMPQLQFQDLSLPRWIHDIAKDFFNFMKADKLSSRVIEWLVHLPSKGIDF